MKWQERHIPYVTIKPCSSKDTGLERHYEMVKE